MALFAKDTPVRITSPTSIELRLIVLSSELSGSISASQSVLPTHGCGSTAEAVVPSSPQYSLNSLCWQIATRLMSPSIICSRYRPLTAGILRRFWVESKEAAAVGERWSFMGDRQSYAAK
jgi:hypothetical protein